MNWTKVFSLALNIQPLLQVLCNNPKKYAVVEPEGKILGQKCVDIVIR